MGRLLDTEMEGETTDEIVHKERDNPRARHKKGAPRRSSPATDIRHFGRPIRVDKPLHEASFLCLFLQQK
jgi:hypothetical protein